MSDNHVVTKSWSRDPVSTKSILVVAEGFFVPISILDVVKYQICGSRGLYDLFISQLTPRCRKIPKLTPSELPGRTPLCPYMVNTVKDTH